MKRLKNAGYEVTADQWNVLFALWEEDGQFQKQLADKLMKDKPSITRILDSLANKNLISRLADATDRRKFKIVLTPPGRRAVIELLPTIAEANDYFSTVLTREELLTLRELLNKIYYALQKEGEL